jgi:ABC-type phosphate transport system substrate-binding protein
MRALMLRLILALVLALPLLGHADVLRAQQARSEVVVIGNATGLEELTRDELRAIFRGERSVWSTGSTVVIALPSTRSPDVDAFATQVLGMSRSAMQRFWLSLVFQGRASPPVSFDSAEEIIRFVRRTPGAIAVVPATATDIPRNLVVRLR